MFYFDHWRILLSVAWLFMFPEIFVLLVWHVNDWTRSGSQYCLCFMTVYVLYSRIPGRSCDGPFCFRYEEIRHISDRGVCFQCRLGIQGDHHQMLLKWWFVRYAVYVPHQTMWFSLFLSCFSSHAVRDLNVTIASIWSAEWSFKYLPIVISIPCLVWLPSIIFLVNMSATIFSLHNYVMMSEALCSEMLIFVQIFIFPRCFDPVVLVETTLGVSCIFLWSKPTFFFLR